MYISVLMQHIKYYVIRESKSQNHMKINIVSKWDERKIWKIRISLRRLLAEKIDPKHE